MLDGAFTENHDPSPPQTLNREDVCNTGCSPKNLTPTSDSVASGKCHQHLGCKKDIAIASLNINGLCSHKDEIQLLIRDPGIQVLALNETKLDPGFPKELISLAGYQQERLDRTYYGGGFFIYIRDSIKYKRRRRIMTGKNNRANCDKSMKLGESTQFDMRNKIGYRPLLKNAPLCYF